MSGSVDGTPTVSMPICPAGTHPQKRTDGTGYDCVPDVHLRPFALIWQGDCEGWLVVRLSYAPAINPEVSSGQHRTLGVRMASPLARRGKRVPGPEIGLESLAKRVRRGDVKAVIGRLKKKVKAAAGAAAPKKRVAKKAKAKPKARAVRRKK